MANLLAVLRNVRGKAYLDLEDDTLWQEPP
jgi:hypothetical protein